MLQQKQGTIKLGSTAQVLAKCKLNHCRFSECRAAGSVSSMKPGPRSTTKDTICRPEHARSATEPETGSKRFCRTLEGQLTSQSPYRSKLQFSDSRLKQGRNRTAVRSLGKMADAVLEGAPEASVYRAQRSRVSPMGVERDAETRRFSRRLLSSPIRSACCST